MYGVLAQALALALHSGYGVLAQALALALHSGHGIGCRP